MKWVIIIFVMCSLIGSMMWMMPSKREKAQEKLRARGRKLGFQVQLIRLTPPRARGELEPDAYNSAAYRLLRTNLKPQEKDQFNNWQVFRVNSEYNDGLVEGWSWAIGEGTLDAPHLELLNDVLVKMPKDVTSLESTPIHMSVFWDEREGEEQIDQFKTELERFIEAKF